jgi:hypothetical protein
MFSHGFSRQLLTLILQSDVSRVRCHRPAVLLKCRVPNYASSGVVYEVTVWECYGEFMCVGSLRGPEVWAGSCTSVATYVNSSCYLSFTEQFLRVCRASCRIVREIGTAEVFRVRKSGLDMLEFCRLS